MLFVVRLSHFSRDVATLSMAWAIVSSTELERSGGNKNGQETPCRIMIHFSSLFVLTPSNILLAGRKVFLI